MSDTPESWVDIAVDITDEQAKYLVLAGIFTRRADGILQITPAGSKWLKEWCDGQLGGAV